MFQNILLPVDLNQESSWQKALPIAVEYCNAFGAALHVMNVVPDFGSALVGSYFPEGFEKKSLEGAREQLHDFVGKHVPDGVTVQHVVGYGLGVGWHWRLASAVDRVACPKRPTLESGHISKRGPCKFSKHWRDASATRRAVAFQASVS